MRRLGLLFAQNPYRAGFEHDVDSVLDTDLPIYASDAKAATIEKQAGASAPAVKFWPVAGDMDTLSRLIMVLHGPPASAGFSTEVATSSAHQLRRRQFADNSSVRQRPSACAGSSPVRRKGSPSTPPCESCTPSCISLRNRKCVGMTRLLLDVQDRCGWTSSATACSVAIASG
ncbi:hypothetical protein SBBP2_700024 [Burkholderiales bacterium]|nr:hypothetical protein SBBP2_700024 [Burkholderiales bacterium]